MGTTEGQGLFSISETPNPQSIPINGRCHLRTQGGWCVVSVGGLPVHHYPAGDRIAEAYSIVCLVRAGFATQVEVGGAFGCSSRTVRRYLGRFQVQGMGGLDARPGWRPGISRLSSRRLSAISSLRASGISNRQIARRLKVTENAIRKVVRRLSEETPKKEQPFLSGMPPPPKETIPVPGVSPTVQSSRAPPSPVDTDAESPRTIDGDPTDRWMDRLLAAMGLLDDAAPLFRSGESLPRAGVLLALPPLIATGLFDVAKEVYGDLAPAFYGLRTTFLVLLLLALLRIKRPENLKEYAPGDLGGIFGLDRAPEVRTVRRKLARLAKAGRAEQFGRLMAQRRVAVRGKVLGFLYTDGHVRVYHGKHRIPKAFVAQMRMVLPATTDYWVNDQEGDPIFVLTAEANAGLTRMLPRLIKEIRPLVGRRRVTIVFDRGGWSPKLFKTLIAQRFDILTYRKEPIRKIPPAQFHPYRGRIDGRFLTYDLDDRNIRLLRGALRLRQVTRLTSSGHQTAIVTSRKDLSALVVAYRMFNRWKQENFFKYLREEFVIDALVDYSVEPADPERTVPNPARRRLRDTLRTAREKLAELQKAYGAAALKNPEVRRPTMRGFKIAHGKLAQAIRRVEERIAELRQKQKALPTHVPVSQAHPGETVKLSTERKHLTNILKMVAYQAESDLLALVRPAYARADDEGRTLIQSALTSEAELRVENKALHVTLSPLSSPHRTKAIGVLCEALNGMNSVFPGTDLRLHYAIRETRWAEKRTD